MTTTNTGAAPAALVPLDTCEPAFLVAWGHKLRLAFYLAGDRLVVRPLRNATPAQLRLHAALIARRDEVARYLLDSRPHPMTSEQAADAASWRVLRMPHETFISLVIHEANRWLREADEGRVTYDPGPPPHMQPEQPAPDATPASASRPPARRPRRLRRDTERITF